MIIEYDKNLLELNTFRVEAVAQKFILIQHASELNLPELCSLAKTPFYVLGQGSNTLFVSGSLPTILKFATNRLKIEKTASWRFITADAGQVMHELVRYCVQNNYGGLENLALIPGTVGASPVQNVGAYGLEIKDVLHCMEVFDVKTHDFKRLHNKDCQFKYRESIFKRAPGRYIICNVTFKLPLHPSLNIAYKSLSEYLQAREIVSPTIQDVYDAVCAIRAAKLPDVSHKAPNAGSFFKNPVISQASWLDLCQKYPELRATVLTPQSVKLNAAQLIELSKAEIAETEKVGLWPQQPLIVVNKDKASGREVYDFSQRVISKVEEKFGIILDREVNIV